MEDKELRELIMKDFNGTRDPQAMGKIIYKLGVPIEQVMRVANDILGEERFPE